MVGYRLLLSDDQDMSAPKITSPKIEDANGLDPKKDSKINVEAPTPIYARKGVMPWNMLTRCRARAAFQLIDLPVMNLLR